jgi:hypothetical protein
MGVMCFLIWALAGFSDIAWSRDVSIPASPQLGSEAQQADSLAAPIPAKPAPPTYKRAIVDGDQAPMTLLYAIIRSPKSSEIIRGPRERSARRHRINTFSAAWSL